MYTLGAFRSIREIANSYTMLLEWCYMNKGLAQEQGEPVYKKTSKGDQILVGYKLPYYFNTIRLNMWRSKLGPSPKIVYRNALVTRYLNPEKTLEEVQKFMVDMVKYCTTNPYTDIRAIKVEADVADTWDKFIDVDKIASPARYYWTGDITAKEKRQIIIKSVTETKVIQTVRAIENCIDYEMEVGERFITLGLIKKRTGLSDKTVYNHIDAFRGAIDKHNETMFGTDSFAMYQRMLSHHKITKSIEKIKLLNEKITKAKVSRDSNLHYNTVNKVWNDEEVQQVLNDFNEIKSTP